MVKGDIVKAAVSSKSTKKDCAKILIHIGALSFIDPDDVEGYIDLLKLKRCIDDPRIIRVVDRPSDSIREQYLLHLSSFEPYFPINETLRPITLRKVRKITEEHKNRM